MGWVLIPTAIVLVCLSKTNNEFYYTKWYVGAIFAAVICGKNVARATQSRWAGFLYAWVLLSGLYVTIVSPSYYRDAVVNTLVQMGYQSNQLDQTVVFRGFLQYSAEALITFMIFTSAALCINKESIARIVEKTFGYLGLLSSIIAIYNCVAGNFWTYKRIGFFDQNSMEGVFIAVTYPLLLGSRSLWNANSIWYKVDIFSSVLLPPIACILLCIYGKASQPILLIAGAIAFDLIRNNWSVEWNNTTIFPSTTKKILFACISILTAMAIGSFFDVGFYDPSGRPQIYKMALGFVSEMESFVWGLGTGTWPVWTYYLQIADKLTHLEYFIWLHSDWLQVLVEQGAIGFVLLVCLSVQAMIRGLKKQGYRATALLTYGAAMIFNYPMHLAVHAFLGLFLLRVCLRKED